MGGQPKRERQRKKERMPKKREKREKRKAHRQKTALINTHMCRDARKSVPRGAEGGSASTSGQGVG
eukprot:501608-Rhodomonas_salina.4